MSVHGNHRAQLTRRTNAQLKYGAAHRWERDPHLDELTRRVIFEAVDAWERDTETYYAGWPDDWRRWENALHDMPGFRHMDLREFYAIWTCNLPIEDNA